MQQMLDNKCIVIKPQQSLQILAEPDRLLVRSERELRWLESVSGCCFYAAVGCCAQAFYPLTKGRPMSTTDKGEGTGLFLAHIGGTLTQLMFHYLPQFEELFDPMTKEVIGEICLTVCMVILGGDQDNLAVARGSCRLIMADDLDPIDATAKLASLAAEVTNHRGFPVCAIGEVLVHKHLLTMLSSLISAVEPSLQGNAKLQPFDPKEAFAKNYQSIRQQLDSDFAQGWQSLRKEKFKS